MQYMLLIYADPKLESNEPYDAWFTYTEEMRKAGAFVSGEPLHGGETATTLRLRDGKRLVTDGPFAETKELLIGYYIIEVPDLDAALDWAAKMPDAKQNVLEIRPLMSVPVG